MVTYGQRDTPHQPVQPTFVVGASAERAVVRTGGCQTGRKVGGATGVAVFQEEGVSSEEVASYGLAVARRRVLVERSLVGQGLGKHWAGDSFLGVRTGAGWRPWA